MAYFFFFKPIDLEFKPLFLVFSANQILNYFS